MTESNPNEETCEFAGIPLPLDGGLLTNCSDRAASVHHVTTDLDALRTTYTEHIQSLGFTATPKGADVAFVQGDTSLVMAFFTDMDTQELDVIIQRR
jgi:hypothetical protein